ncbi:unnamed protein product [Clonostachys solani]|uniref:MARVEL domain-containing protein n=1 Tax=Clonostachys solani TaxID=160281 RepID=A0A9N9W8N6_9HYPO|nr:unnamed protein product [Clonostachys solani]
MPFFNPKIKTQIHILSLLLAVGAMAGSGTRIALAEMPMMRPDMMALAAGGKSIAVIGYQLITHHVRACRRAASRKANLILNGLEVLFWAAVAGLGVQTNMNVCKLDGNPLITSCIISWAVSGVAALLCLLAMYSVGVSVVELRQPRHGKDEAEFISLPDMYEDTSPLHPVPPVPYSSGYPPRGYGA